MRLLNMCTGYVKTVTLASVYLYSGNLSSPSTNATAHFVFTLNNPGSMTFITSLQLTRYGVTTTGSTFYNGTRIETVTDGTVIGYVTTSSIDLTVTKWDNNSLSSSPSNSVDFRFAHSGINVLAPAKVTSFTFYPEQSLHQRISSGQLFDYAISFQNGQSISGSLIAI